MHSYHCKLYQLEKIKKKHKKYQLINKTCNTCPYLLTSLDQILSVFMMPLRSSEMVVSMSEILPFSVFQMIKMSYMLGKCDNLQLSHPCAAYSLIIVYFHQETIGEHVQHVLWSVFHPWQLLASLILLTWIFFRVTCHSLVKTRVWVPSDLYFNNNSFLWEEFSVFWWGRRRKVQVIVKCIIYRISLPFDPRSSGNENKRTAVASLPVFPTKLYFRCLHFILG